MKTPLALTFFMTALAACSPAHQPTPSATTTTASARPTGADLDKTTARWIDNHLIDLMSPEGTFLRATVESARIVESSPRQGYSGLDEGYPGYRHAFNASFPAEQMAGGGGTWVGTRFYEVIDARKDGDRYTFTYCDYGSLVARKESDGQYSSTGSDPSWGDWDVTFGPDPKLHASQQVAPKARQRGPGAKPADNVFGTWVMFKRDTVFHPQCKKLAPGTPTNWPNPYVRADPPPTLPPDPGWPDAGSA
ncbi:Uncharacterised protein [Mycobacteroides abscessus subsp. massiliense]|uniref:hypothetical protein n=1 Tax=Mycobacteroides abscessus TaxID=36809 RepID=UPI0009C58916|nr:hypothetical protein [Mycobacteroides abscessus]SLI10616.1 Uncharacterised protein [Mycobacteroides abscessus subsp. massiliense]